MVRTSNLQVASAPSPRVPLPSRNYYAVLANRELPAIDCTHLPATALPDVKHVASPPRRSPILPRPLITEDLENSETHDDSDAELAMSFGMPWGPRPRRPPIFDEKHTGCLDPRRYNEVFATVRELERLTRAFHYKVDAWSIRAPGSASHKILRAQIDRLVPLIIQITQQVVFDAVFLKLRSYVEYPTQAFPCPQKHYSMYAMLNFTGLQQDTQYVSYRYEKEFAIRGGWVETEEEEVAVSDFGHYLNPYQPAHHNINLVVRNLDPLSQIMPEFQ